MAWVNFFKRNKTSIIQLSDVIFKNSLECAEEVKQYIDDLPDPEFQLTYIYILFEFMYFFMHMTNLIAYALLGDAKRRKLQKKLGPIIIGSTIETYFGDGPQKMKEEIRNHFFKQLNILEIEYSDCTELLSKDHPFTGNALFSKLSKNVAEVSGSPENPEMIMQVLTISTNVWNFRSYKKLIIDVQKEL